MKVAFIQLSDIHFRNEGNFISDRAEAIAAAAWSHTGETARQYFLITGDIAFSGKIAEYDLAQTFLSLIKNAGKRAFPASADPKVLIIPGNHDCDFSGNQELRATVLEKGAADLSQGPPASPLIQTLHSVQSNFFTFLTSFPADAIPTDSKTLWIFEDSIGQYSLRFILFNTAIASQLHEKQGDIFILTGDIKSLNSLSPRDYSIALLHHPLNWLSANNAIQAGKIIESTADMVFSGHQHVDSSFRRERLGDKISSLFFEATVLQESVEGLSGFRVVIVDLENRSFTSTLFNWDGSSYRTENEGSGKIPQSKTNRYFAVSPEHERFLNDPGAGFSHPRKETLSLNDLFIPPDLKARRIHPQSDSASILDYERIPSSNALEFLESTNRCLVIGEEQSGKTALAKSLVHRLGEKGKITVFISGTALRSKNAEDTRRLLAPSLKAQFEEDAEERFWQLEQHQRCIIIDDFQKCGLNRQAQAGLLRQLLEVVGALYVFADTFFRFEELYRDDSSAMLFANFDYAEIREFGYRLRAQLIERWHSLGRERVLSENDLAHEASRTERLVEAILGKNLLPSYPFVVLTLLQLAEAGRESSRDAGSYGSMYESLIVSALAKDSKPSDIDVNYAFLSLVAHRMFTLDRRFLSQAEIDDIGKEYEEKVAIQPHLERRLPILSQRKILKLSDSHWEFHYPYIYYYFIARWFRDRVGADPSIREELLMMADNVATERNTNILVFYLALSQDFALVERVLLNAQKIYSSHAPCDFTTSVEFLDTLFKGATFKKTLPSGSKNDRDAHRATLDVEDTQLEYSQTREGSEGQEFREVLELNIAFKTLQILGQFVRNFPGSLEASLKRRIVEQCYSLGLRSLSSIFGVAEQSLDELRLYFSELVRDRRALLSESDERRAGDQGILWLTRACAFGVIKRISNAVGLEELEQTFDAIIKDNNTISTRLIDISVKLDHFAHPPEAEIMDLGKDVRKSPFISVVLNDLVNQYLLTFPVSQKQRQRLLSWLEIKGPTPKYFDNPQRKRRS
jgi:Calcineurin-like phosphoesterase/ATPase family associated with various cellular activities (AAA)